MGCLVFESRTIPSTGTDGPATCVKVAGWYTILLNSPAGFFHNFNGLSRSRAGIDSACCDARSRNQQLGDPVTSDSPECESPELVGLWRGECNSASCPPRRFRGSSGLPDTSEVVVIGPRLTGLFFPDVEASSAIDELGNLKDRSGYGLSVNIDHASRQRDIVFHELERGSRAENSLQLLHDRRACHRGGFVSLL
jgi:hypothetical protein